MPIIPIIQNNTSVQLTIEQIQLFHGKIEAVLRFILI
jgi:hypothetical protein